MMYCYNSTHIRMMTRKQRLLTMHTVLEAMLHDGSQRLRCDDLNVASVTHVSKR